MPSLKPRREEKKAYAQHSFDFVDVRRKRNTTQSIDAKIGHSWKYHGHPTPRRQKRHREKREREKKTEFLFFAVALRRRRHVKYTHKRRPGDWPPKQTAAAVCQHIT